MPPPRSLRVTLRPEWAPVEGPPEGRGLFAEDQRVRTLVKVLLTYPEVRYVLPDRVGLDAGAGLPLLEALTRFLGRQTWLVERAQLD